MRLPSPPQSACAAAGCDGINRILFPQGLGASCTRSKTEDQFDFLANLAVCNKETRGDREYY